MTSTVRHESSVVSISWIPSEAIRSPTRAAFDWGIFHYDEPPPPVLAGGGEELERLLGEDRFRFANELRAWIEVEDGKIVGYGQSGGVRIGTSRIRLGRTVAFQNVAFPDIRPEPEMGRGWVRFIQTAGGRTGVPAPRPVTRPPFFRLWAPAVWTTLALTIHADGTSEHAVLGASGFPRHWIYDHTGQVRHKSGLLEFKDWSGRAFGDHTPWGAQDSPAVVTAAETALERELSAVIMGGGRPEVRTVKEGRALVEQGHRGDELFLLLDGVLEVEVDGRPLVELGPGAVLGERAVLEGGQRTATVRAVTTSRVAVVPGDRVDPSALAALADDHHREDR